MSKASTSKGGAILYREASAADGAAIGLLHAQCWLGEAADKALARTIVSERQALWRERSARTDPATRLVVAESGGEPIGFACAYARRDPQFGSLLDNLHVAKAWQTQGVGSALLRDIAGWSAAVAPDDGLYLWLLPTNRAARAFYLRRGAGALITANEHAAARAAMLRFGWRRPASLLAGQH
ncbi:GNAT family N-acetyltransferase [Chitinolyticbacter meiyuanensis]|uniref:GNAT family N-acetyltransferase n=1 Tax=Chitinolyticbacter meiyuanensis TaxID=682798 RepID=UPI0011E5E249|nr:GNAT family N-acetyltransferase [Chitinolyticbacter meiyuanensis]